MEANEDPEIALENPEVWYDIPEATAEEMAEAMKVDKGSLREFDVYDEVYEADCTEEQLRNAYNHLWVHGRRKGKLKSRLTLQGQHQRIKDRGETYASTPIFATLRILMLLALACCWSIILCDVSTAFLHGDTQAREQLILHYAPLVKYVAGRVGVGLKVRLGQVGVGPKSSQAKVTLGQVGLGPKSGQAWVRVGQVPV